MAGVSRKFWLAQLAINNLKTAYQQYDDDFIFLSPFQKGRLPRQHEKWNYQRSLWEVSKWTSLFRFQHCKRLHVQIQQEGWRDFFQLSVWILFVRSLCNIIRSRVILIGKGRYDWEQNWKSYGWNSSIEKRIDQFSLKARQ